MKVVEIDCSKPPEDPERMKVRDETAAEVTQRQTQEQQASERAATLAAAAQERADAIGRLKADPKMTDVVKVLGL